MSSRTLREPAVEFGFEVSAEGDDRTSLMEQMRISSGRAIRNRNEAIP
ncbi:hypothetical protein quinque_000146, partial [Culex quinquefasciatus]